ncbi:hypothetical protein ACP70R_044255 [Stipagrostis hirtigluma subsp. patula]
MATEKEYFREKSKFRKFLDAVRQVLAGIGALSIIGVIAYSLSVALRPEKLTLWVQDGVVSAVSDNSSAAPTLRFGFTLQAANPSGRARIYYVNIMATIGGKNTSTSPPMPFVKFHLDQDLAVVQQESASVFARATVGEEEMRLSYFGMLYNGSIIDDAWMSLNGTLITGVNSIVNRTRQAVVYNCSSLTVGGGSTTITGDVLCKE